MANPTKLERLRSMQSEKTEFKREISLFGGVNIIAGIMVGSGIFYLGSYVLMYSGMSMGLALLCWIVGGLITLISGLSYAELGAMLPRAGGAYVYLREAYGPGFAFAGSFSSFLLGSSGSIAGLAVALATFINQVLPGEIGAWGQKLIAVGFIVLLSLYNMLGIKHGSWVQNIFMVAKLIPIVIIIVLGLTMGQQSPDLSLSVEGASAWNWVTMLAFGVMATMWAYEGWVNLNTVTEEIKKPKRNLPLAIIIAICGVTVLYFLFNLSVYKTVPADVVGSEIAAGNVYLGTEAAKSLLGGFGGTLVSICMLVAVFGALNGCVMVFPREYYAMAQDGAMFSMFGKLSEKRRTPVNSILASMVVSILLVSFNLSQLANLVVFSGMVYKIFTFVAVIIFRKRYPELERPYKVPLYPVLIYIAIFAMLVLMACTFFDNNWWVSALSLVVPVIGFAVYKLSNFGRGKKSEASSQQQGE